MPTKRGRKSEVEKFSSEQLLDIKKLISEFKETNGISGKIEYMDMYRYALNRFEDGSYPIRHSDDFWRKPNRVGRQYIDESNALFTNTYIPLKDDDEELAIPSVVYAVHTFKKEEELIKYLQPLEKILEKSIKKEERLKSQITKLEKKIEQLRKELSNAKRYEDALFMLFRYSADTKNKLANVLTPINNTASVEAGNQLVLRSLEKLFTNPSSIFNWYDQKLEQFNNETQNAKETSITSLDQYKTKRKSALDDLGWRD